MVNAVILQINGNILNINIRLFKKERTSNVSTYFNKFKRHINNKTDHSIELIDTWEVEDFLLVGYGISTGNESELNQHELFPTKNKKHFYGSILIIKTNLKKQIIDLTANLYEKYYNHLYGYYSDNDSSDVNVNNNLDEYSLNCSSNESIPSINESESENDGSETLEQEIIVESNNINNNYYNNENELEYESYVSDY